MPPRPSPWAEIAPLLTSAVRAKFDARVDHRGADECWPWTGQLNQYGYPMLYVSGRRVGVVATRLAFYWGHGHMADDKYVCHRCDNPACVNPGHLWLGTHAENLKDMRDKGRGNPWNRGKKTGPRRKAA